MRLMVVVALLYSICAGAQTFEGSIKWSIKTEMDPSVQAQMQQHQMTDQQRKELQEKMNDPQMKAMMEKNPQMKAQMEAMMNNQSNDPSSMMPKEMLVRVRGNNSLTTMSGGMMNMEILNKGDEGKSYRIDRQNKTYSEMNIDHMQGNSHAPDMTVTKTSETTKILGYTCTRYDITFQEHGNTMTNTVWATNEIHVDPKMFAQQRMGRDNMNFMEKIDGVPLKMEMKMPKMTMTMEAVDISKGAQPASDFVIPSDYKEVPMGMGMMGQ